MTGMVRFIPTIYGDDWGMVYDSYTHSIPHDHWWNLNETIWIELVRDGVSSNVRFLERLVTGATETLRRQFTCRCKNIAFGANVH